MDNTALLWSAIQKLLAAVVQIASCTIVNHETVRYEVERATAVASRVLASGASPQEQHLIMVLRKCSSLLNRVVTARLAVMSSSKAELRRSRLPKDKLGILESWFVDHRKHPYLNPICTERLMRATSLTRLQLQNWVSNRRRKEKQMKVAPEIMALLN
ncbi:uncharacterized protein LODBEIA_P38540 [Lodderomyces beijingensis]|uniref:Homeobox domain-containing protein n=1 Tax=Lodderomyces beijingensis TaxID=1775926 RepID=A0ABP0ZTZ5_9ASCO